MEERKNITSRDDEGDIIIKQTEENIELSAKRKTDQDKSEIIENLSLDFRMRKQKLRILAFK